jgi:hypothetical protein
MSQKKSGFREHVTATPRADYPREDEIKDRRAFIVALGGAIAGGVLSGCRFRKNENVAGGMEWPKAKLDKGMDAGPEAGPPDLNASSGIPDGPRAWKDRSIGWPDITPAKLDMQPDKTDMKRELGPAGLPPMPDAGADKPDLKRELGPAGLPPMPDAGADKKKP